MNNFSTLILAGGRGKRLFPLTRNRAKPAIRFGGIYRIIDFTLSNCVNSDVKRIYILTQYASTSLERYIRFGWGHYFRSDFGEFIETRPPQLIISTEWYKGTADSVFRNIDLIEEDESGGTLILSGDHIYKMDYRKMVDYHNETKADVIVACIDLPCESAVNFGVMKVNEGQQIQSFEEKPEQPAEIPKNPGKSLCNMGVYFFNNDVLIDVLQRDSEINEGRHDFGHDIIPFMVANDYRVMAYDFIDENKKVSKYWRDIGTIEAYFEANMDLITIDPLFNLYDNSWPIKSFNPQLPPSKIVFNWVHENRVGIAIDSLLSQGVIVSGGKVMNSILSPNVRIDLHSQVSDSILFDNVSIGKGAVVNNAIIDQGVHIADGMKVGVDYHEDMTRFHVSEKGICVVTDSLK